MDDPMMSELTFRASFGSGGGCFCLSPPLLVMAASFAALGTVAVTDLTERALCSRCRRRCRFAEDDATGDLQNCHCVYRETK